MFVNRMVGLTVLAHKYMMIFPVTLSSKFLSVTNDLQDVNAATKSGLSHNHFKKNRPSGIRSLEISWILTSAVPYLK